MMRFANWVMTDTLVPRHVLRRWSLALTAVAIALVLIVPDRLSLVEAQIGRKNVCRVISAATTNSTLCVARGALIGTITLSNINAAVRYVKVYDKITAPVVGTDVPTLTFAVEGKATGAPSSISFPIGPIFQNGLGLAITTGAADNDTGAVAAGEIIVNLVYRER